MVAGLAGVVAARLALGELPCFLSPGLPARGRVRATVDLSMSSTAAWYGDRWLGEDLPLLARDEGLGVWTGEVMGVCSGVVRGTASAWSPNISCIEELNSMPTRSMPPPSTAVALPIIIAIWSSALCSASALTGAGCLGCGAGSGSCTSRG